MGTPIGPGADQGGWGPGDLRAWELWQLRCALPFPQTPWRVDLLPPTMEGLAGGPRSGLRGVLRQRT